MKQPKIAESAFRCALFSTSIALLVGCGATQPPGLDGSGMPKAPETGVHQCKVSKDTARPMLVEWPAVEKAALQATAAQSLIVVRYDGCRLKQMPRCSYQSSYNFVETSRAQDGFAVKDKTELFAKLPLGAISLEGELSQGRQLSLSYVAVGARTADAAHVTREAVTGQCQGATHYVRTMIVGAYALSSEAAVGGGAGVSVASAGVGGSHEKSTEVIRRDGNLEDCLDESTPATEKRCQAIVQLILEPLGAQDDTPATAPFPKPEIPAAALTAEPTPHAESAAQTPTAEPERAGPRPKTSYRARLSEADHHSTDGSQLRVAALVLRQDRYNFHVAGRRDPEDESDSVLGTKSKRAKLQGWLADRIPADVEHRILHGTPLVEVSIFSNRAEVRIIAD